jgi:hypothetical protein
MADESPALCLRPRICVWVCSRVGGVCVNVRACVYMCGGAGHVRPHHILPFSVAYLWSFLLTHFLVIPVDRQVLRLKSASWLRWTAQVRVGDYNSVIFRRHKPSASALQTCGRTGRAAADKKAKPCMTLLDQWHCCLERGYTYQHRPGLQHYCLQELI